jgi:hypothetical protein
VPVKPEEKPELPDKSNPRLLPDENTWVFEEFERLQTEIRKAVAPVQEYLETFEKYQKEYDLDPEAEIAKFQQLDDLPDPKEL